MHHYYRNIRPKDTIYMNESLTQQRSKLFYKARMMKRQRRTENDSLVIKELHGRIRPAKTSNEIEKKMFSSLPISTPDANASPSN